MKSFQSQIEKLTKSDIKDTTTFEIGSTKTVSVIYIMQKGCYFEPTQQLIHPS